MWVVGWIISQVTRAVTVDVRKAICDFERETERAKESERQTD